MALQERQRLQDIGLPYTAIVAEDGIEFVEGTMETLESDVLEQQWFSDIELALAHSVRFQMHKEDLVFRMELSICQSYAL